MKIIVEMTFKNNGGLTRSFAETYAPNNYNPVRVAYPIVRERLREFYGHVEIDEVKVNEEDITKRILEVHKVYDRKLFYKFDDQLPF